MTRIRILLADMPRLLHDILHDTLAAQPDMDVVGGAVSRDALRTMLPSTHPDVVAVGVVADDAAALAALARELLALSPESLVVAIAIKGHRATLFDRHARATVLDDVSPSSLVAGIRSARARAAGGRHED